MIKIFICIAISSFTSMSMKELDNSKNDESNYIEYFIPISSFGTIGFYKKTYTIKPKRSYFYSGDGEESIDFNNIIEPFKVDEAEIVDESKGNSVTYLCRENFLFYLLKRKDGYSILIKTKDENKWFVVSEDPRSHTANIIKKFTDISDRKSYYMKYPDEVIVFIGEKTKEDLLRQLKLEIGIRIYNDLPDVFRPYFKNDGTLVLDIKISKNENLTAINFENNPYFKNNQLILDGDFVFIKKFKKKDWSECFQPEYEILDYSSIGPGELPLYRYYYIYVAELPSSQIFISYSDHLSFEYLNGKSFCSLL